MRSLRRFFIGAVLAVATIASPVRTMPSCCQIWSIRRLPPEARQIQIGDKLFTTSR